MRGTCVFGLTDADIWRLDIFEGSEYLRKKVKIKVLEDGLEVEVDAETYIWCGPQDGLENQEWSFDDFKAEKLHRWIGEAAEYEGEIRPSIVGPSIEKKWLINS